MALGTDAGGSIRLPAAFCGVYGLSPTHGRVPYSSVGARVQTCLRLGPIATCVRDVTLAHLLLAPAAAGHPYTAQYGLAGPPPPHAAGMRAAASASDVGPLRGTRVGVMRAWFDDGVPEVVRACREALRALEALGAELVAVELPHLAVLAMAHAIIVSSEMAAVSDGAACGRAYGAMEPATRIALALGSTFSATEYLAACRLRGWALDAVRRTFAAHRLHVLATPTAPCAPPVLSAAARECGESDSGTVMALMRFIFLANLLGMPGLTMPVGYDAAGLPIGFHLLADQWDEAELLRTAHALELALARAGVPARPPAAHFADILRAAAA